MYEEIEKRVKTMDIPFFRKKVINTKDLKWLYKKLKIKNENHPLYQETIEIIKRELKIKC